MTGDEFDYLRKKPKKWNWMNITALCISILCVLILLGMFLWLRGYLGDLFSAFPVE